MKVGYLQGVVGKLVMIPLLLISLVGLVPIADPAGRVLAVALGFLGALVGLGLYALVVGRASSEDVGPSYKYFSGAITGYEHGSIGRGATLLRALALLVPMGIWVFSVIAAVG